MDPAWPGSGPPPPHGPEEWIGGQQQQGYAGHAPPAHSHAFSPAPSASLPAAHPSAAGPAYLPAYSSYDVERILAASEQGQGAVQAGYPPTFLAGPSSSNHAPPFPTPYSTQQPLPSHQQSLVQRQAYPAAREAYSAPPYHLPQPSHPAPFTSSYPNQPSYPSHLTTHSPYPSYAPHQPPQHPPAAQPRSWQKRRAAQYDDLADETRSSSAPVPPQTGIGQPEWVQQLGQAQQRVPNGLPLPPPQPGQAVLPPTSAGFTPQLEPAATAYHYPPGPLSSEAPADNAGAGPPFAFSGDLPFPPSADPLQPGPSSGYPTLGAVEPFQTHSRATTHGSTASTSSRSGSTASFSSATANFPTHLPPAVPPPPPPLHAQPEAAYDFAHYPLQAPSETTAHPPPDALLPPPSSHLPPSASLPPPPARQTPNSAYSSAPHPLLLAPSSSCQPPPALGPRLPPPNPANPVPTTSHTTSLSSASLSRPDSASAPAPAQPSDPAHAHFLTLASVRRLAHASLPPPLAYKPARSGAGLTAEEDAAQERLERRRREKELLERGRVNFNQAGGVGSLDFVVRCAGGGGECDRAIQSPDGKGKGRPLARVVLRGLSAGMVAAVEAEERRREPLGRPVRALRLGGAVVSGVDGPRCWACVGKKEGEEGVVRAGAPLSDSTAAGGGSSSASSAPPPVVQGGRKRKAAAKTREEGRVEGPVGSDKGYEDTLSAAIDRLELGGKRREKNEDEKSFSAAALEAESEDEGEKEWEGLLLVEEKKAEEGWKKEAMKCDVCSLTCGIGTFSPSSLVSSAAASSSSTTLPDFTVEIICARCDGLFKCCSDCGGGGGRLTPGRWRSKELFPDGRKTCKLSHARNPALGEVTIDVLPLSPTPPSNLSSLENRCRQIYFNARLGTIARPEFLLRGDGLARSYDEVYKVTVDHWSLLSGLLGEQPDESMGVKHYLTLMYSTPRKRHAVRTDKDGEPVRKSSKKSKEPEKVAFGFAIAVADLNDGTLFFCCVMPWPINGQAFDAMTLLGESTTSRVKSDLRALNASRSSAGKEPFGRLTYNYLVSPFKLDSRANMGLSRRGYEPIDEVEKKDPELKRECFPPLKEVWLPKPYAAALQVYIRRLESEDDLGGPPADNAPRKRARKSTTTAAALVGSAAASTPSSSASPASVQPTDYSPFSTTSSLPLQAAGYAYPGMSPAFSSLPLDLPTPPYHPHPATPDMAPFSSSTLYSPFNPSSPFFDPSSSSSFIYPSHPPPPPS